jgi:hypothetical protein
MHSLAQGIALNHAGADFVFGNTFAILSGLLRFRLIGNVPE